MFGKGNQWETEAEGGVGFGGGGKASLLIWSKLDNFYGLSCEIWL